MLLYETLGNTGLRETAGGHEFVRAGNDVVMNDKPRRHGGHGDSNKELRRRDAFSILQSQLNKLKSIFYGSPPLSLFVMGHG
jgi:hypothetical protein